MQFVFLIVYSHNPHPTTISRLCLSHKVGIYSLSPKLLTSVFNCYKQLIGHHKLVGMAEN